MNQYSFATVIQRLYRLLSNADDPCQLIESVCRLLSNEEEFVFVWVDSSEAFLKKQTICYSKGNIFKNPDCHLIAQHISDCNNFKEARLNGGLHKINSHKNDRCVNVIRKYFKENNSAAILSASIQHNDVLFGHLNLLIKNVDNITDETQLLIKELASDIGIKLHEIISQIPIQKKSYAVNSDKEQYYKNLLHCLYEDIIVIDKDYNIVDVNNGKLKISNKKTEEILGTKCYSTIKESDKPCNLLSEECVIQEVMQSGLPKQVRHKYISDDGQIRYFDILFSPFRNQNGQTEKVIETIRDVTQVVKVEEKLKAKELQLKQIANNLDVIFFELDVSNVKPKIIYLSEGFKKIWGIDTELALSNQRLWYNSVFPEDRYIILNLIRDYLKTKNPNIKAEFRIVKPDNTISWISVKTRIIDDSVVNSKRVFGIAEDITEKKLLELELQNAYQKSKESVNFKNYLLGNINHEIRTPLNAILGFTQILKEEKSIELVEELSDKILKASSRLLFTLDTIIELSDLQSDSRKIQKNEISIIELLKTLHHKFYSTAKEKNLIFEVVEPDQDVIIQSDEFLLKKILYQLLDNAFKYTNNGSVTLSVRFNKNSDENWLVVDVADTGIGIETNQLDTIFEAFRQGSEGLSRSYQGTGLGLTITKKMVELLQGKICVESEKGIGTKFSVHIPYEIPTKSKDTSFKNNGFSVFEGKRILIVEDNELNTEVLKHYLKGIVNTDFASNSSEVYSLMSKYSYDLILMDISLKNGENGIEVMKNIKMTGNSEIPIVALTAFTFDDDKNKFLAEGFDGFIPKPIQRNDLIEVIKGILKNKNLTIL